MLIVRLVIAAALVLLVVRMVGVAGALRGCWFVVKFLAMALVVVPIAGVVSVVLVVWGLLKVVAWLLSQLGWCWPLKLAEGLEERLK
jgi:hypothetical protein